jgi:ankyrin repeat protein
VESGRIPKDVVLPDGYTLVHIAVERVDVELLTRVLDEFALPIDILSKHGQTALLIASLRGNLPLMKFLLDRGANIEAKDNRGNTPLLAAVQYGANDAALILISQGADMA